MIKCVGWQFCNWTIMVWRLAQSHIREHHIYCSTVREGRELHCKISTFPSDVPIKIWTPQLKWTVITFFSSPSFFFSQVTKKLLALGKQTQPRGSRTWFCKDARAKQFHDPCSFKEKKKNHVSQATEGKGVYYGLLLSDYCVKDVLKSSSGWSHHGVMKGEPNTEMRKLKQNEVKGHVAGTVWIWTLGHQSLES